MKMLEKVAWLVEIGSLVLLFLVVSNTAIHVGAWIYWLFVLLFVALEIFKFKRYRPDYRPSTLRLRLVEGLLILFAGGALGLLLAGLDLRFWLALGLVGLSLAVMVIGLAIEYQVLQLKRQRKHADEDDLLGDF